MDLRVGDKAIIVNSKHHSKYNFQKCTVESIKGDKAFAAIFGETYKVEFWLERNELIPLTYENYEECVKYGVDLNEYKGYYECLCKAVDEVGNDCNKKDEEIKSLKNKNNELMDENASLKEQLEYEQCKSHQATKQRELDKLRIAVDVLSCRLAECQKER